MPTSKGLPGNRQFAAEWVEKDSQDNAMAKAVRAAGAGQHYATGILVSFSTSAPAVKLVQIKSGSTILEEFYVDFAQSLTARVPFDAPIPATLAEAMSVEIPASGTGGVIGKAHIEGFTLGA